MDKRFGGFSMSQLSDATMNDVPMMTDSQLERETGELFSATDPENDRLLDALADKPAEVPAVPANANDDTGVGGSDEGEEDEESEEEEAPVDGGQNDGETSGVAGLMQNGREFMQRFASTQDSQVTDDGIDYEEEEIRKEYAKITTSTWMHKKISKAKTDMSKLLSEHESSKKKLVAPVKEMVNLYPERKEGLVLLSALLSDACADNDLREMFIEAGSILKSQVKMIESIQQTMKVIEVGEVCVVEKEAEEKKKRGVGGDTMAAAAALVSSVTASKKSRNK